jgi:hypothetical protein
MQDTEKMKSKRHAGSPYASGVYRMFVWEGLGEESVLFTMKKAKCHWQEMDTTVIEGQSGRHWWRGERAKPGGSIMG